MRLRFMTVPTARAARGWPTRCSKRAVCGRLPVGHARELVEDGDRECRQLTQVERQVERAAAAREVLVELAARAVHASRRAEDARAGDAGKLLEALARVGVERDRREAAIRRRDEEIADGRVDDVVADVDQTERRGRVAEAPVEIRRDGHEVILLRMRRTPVDVACRAASGDEPSADAICSYERS